MANTKMTIPLRSPLVDARGLLTSPWAQFFQAVYGRIGGAESITIKEIHEAAFDDAGIAEQHAEIEAIAQNIGQLTIAEVLQNFADYLPKNEPVQTVEWLQSTASAQQLEILQERLNQAIEQLAVLERAINDIKQSQGGL